MGTLVTEKVASNTAKFLASFRLGIDIGDKAHGVAVVQGNQVVCAATLLDESATDLKTRRQLRRGRRTRASRRQRLGRLRQWCLRNHLPDPDPYFNPEISSAVWPPDRDGKPTSALASLTEEQRRICHTALKDSSSWQQFLNLPNDARHQCALVNPFIARRLAREGRATPLVFVRALWHLFEHRGFDWYARTRGEPEEEDFLESKGALLRHLKTLVLPEKDVQKKEEEIRQRDAERKTRSQKAKPWLEDPDVRKELEEAHKRGQHFPTQRRLNPPRHYVEAELQQCLRSLPVGDLGEEFGRKKGQPPLSDEEKRNVAFRGLKKLLNWNRREPRFDNRQLRGCTWCAARGIQRNTPRKKNVVDLLVQASIRDIKVAAGEAARIAEAEARKQKRITPRQRLAITAATRWLAEDEFNEVWRFVSDGSLDRANLKQRLDGFFQGFARLPKRVFVEEGGQLKKKPKLHDPYEWHREELLNFADGLHQRRPLKGRVRLCRDCLKLKADNPPDQLEPPVGEAEVMLSQRQLKARCNRLVAWVEHNLKQFPIEYIRIEAVLPRPEERARLKAQAAEGEVEQTPKEKLKVRLMEQVGARCRRCRKPYQERERRGPEAKRDKGYCQCLQLDLEGDCAYCGKPFPAQELQIEHIYPKNPIDTSGGIGPDAQINKTVACPACNQGEKKNRLPSDYFQHIVGGNSWEEWKRRIRTFNWPPAKRKIALLEQYKLPEDLGDIALARTGMVHRYLRQRLAGLFFPDQIKSLKDGNASIEQRKEAKVFLDQHLSTPAGWLTSQCRLDWEHIEEDGRVIPLVPRKSPLLGPAQRQKRLEESLGKARNEKHKQDILEGQTRRASIEDQLRKVEAIAVCDRTNRNHHWIDAAVLACLPPQANQPVETGGIWVHRGREVRADVRFAPRAAEFLERWGDGSVVFDLTNRVPRFKARQQETSLYGEGQKGPIIYEPVGNLKVKDKKLIVSDYWRDVFGELSNQEYDFPKKPSDDAAEDNDGEKIRTERRRPENDEPLPSEAWTKWAEEENRKRREQGKGEVSIPKRLRIYFEKLTSNERVAFPGGERAKPSKRGILKPKRVTRMTPVGSHAVIDPETGDLTVLLNPWKRHVEKSDEVNRQEPKGTRLFKGDCIWHPGRESHGKRERKIETGWYRIIEMSPAKHCLSGKTKEPELKTEPAWLDVNQLAQREKAKRDKWEVILRASTVKKLASEGQLRIKRRLEDLPGLAEESLRAVSNNGDRTCATTEL